MLGLSGIAFAGTILDSIESRQQPEGSTSSQQVEQSQSSTGNVVVPPDMMGQVANPPRCWWLNMRQGPGIRFRVIKVLKAGTPLKILGRDPNSGWYKVNDGRVTGWCSNRYITTAGTAGIVPPGGPGGNTGTDTGSNNGGPGGSDGPGGGGTGTTLGGSLNPADFGYDAKRYKPVFDLVAKYSDANSRYKLAGGHTWQDGFASITDCSGFVGSFYQKLAALSGIPPIFPKSSWYPTSTNYKSNRYSRKITSAWPPPNPPDLIKPGDIFVMNKGAKYGHTGVFMGYDRSGNPVIAHSTTRRNNSYIYGKQGSTGVRIEVLPRSYRSRWAGVYRMHRTDEMLDRLGRS